MSKPTEEAHDDFSVWWENNIGRYPIVDQEQRWRFMLTAIRNLARVQAMIIEDIQRLEQRSGSLFTVSGLTRKP